MPFEMIDLYRLYNCESGDVKETENIQNGSICYETDTSKKFRFDGTNWQEFFEISKPLPASSISNTNSLVTVTTTSTTMAHGIA